MLAVEERPVIEAARRNLSVCVLDEQSNQADLTTARLQKAGFPAVGTTHPEDALQTVRAGRVPGSSGGCEDAGNRRLEVSGKNSAMRSRDVRGAGDGLLLGGCRD